uniref:Uncharacterized protein n=1 Tax=Oryza barthii TaxID=65489 RepID=A0A0D3GI67_9ORYZ
MGANRTVALVLAIVLSALLCQALLTSSHAREAPHAPGADSYHLPGDDPPSTLRGGKYRRYPDPPGGRLDPPNCCK